MLLAKSILAGLLAVVLAMVVVFGIAAIKVRLIGLDFMELRSAPIPLRAAFEGYCLVLWGVLSGLYLFL